MKLIVGLGNPGDKYAKTRHNAGRRLVEYIGKKSALHFKMERKLLAAVATHEWDGEPVILAYPETFMNLSGDSVGALVRHYEIEPTKDLLIVIDDAALPFARWRLREKGSDGGHNGLKSIEKALATPDYARLRCGVGSPERAQVEEEAGSVPLEEFVLQPFTADEQKQLGEVFEKGQEACGLWATGPIAVAMSAVNPDKK